MYKQMLMIFFILAIAVFVGCANAAEEVHSENLTSSANDIAPPIGSTRHNFMPNIPPPPLPRLNSFEDLHEVFLFARGEDVWPELDRTERSRRMEAIDFWGIRDMQYYYIPTWVPEGFKLYRIGFSPDIIWYQFNAYDFDFNRVSDLEYSLINSIVFQWNVRGNGGDWLRNIIDRSEMHVSIDGKESMYFHEFGVSPNFEISIVRRYDWLQDDYLFGIDVPLRLIAEIIGIDIQNLYALFDEPLTNAELNQIIADSVRSSDPGLLAEFNQMISTSAYRVTLD